MYFLMLKRIANTGMQAAHLMLETGGDMEAVVH